MSTYKFKIIFSIIKWGKEKGRGKGHSYTRLHDTWIINKNLVRRNRTSGSDDLKKKFFVTNFFIILKKKMEKVRSFLRLSFRIPLSSSFACLWKNIPNRSISTEISGLVWQNQSPVDWFDRWLFVLVPLIHILSCFFTVNIFLVRFSISLAPISFFF